MTTYTLILYFLVGTSMHTTRVPGLDQATCTSMASEFKAVRSLAHAECKQKAPKAPTRAPVRGEG